MEIGHGISQPLDSLPILQNWFERVNGVRFNMAGPNQTYFANIIVKGSSGGLVGTEKIMADNQKLKYFQILQKT
jgi:hypothetical protein